MGLMVERKGFTFSKSCGFRTPAFAADWYALSLKISQPPKVRSFSSARGTNLWMSGERPSVRLPRRIVPICVSDPTGCDLPLRTSSTPAMNVVLTAPMPGSRTPSFPLAGAILEGFSMPLLLLNDQNTIDGRNEFRTRIPQRKRAASPNKQIIMRDAAKICKLGAKNQATPPLKRDAGSLRMTDAGVDIIFILILLWPPYATLLPYTTLFRSVCSHRSRILEA